ncbi:hypothetical protein [Xylanimonas protaetiae]|nr:hypothetical protein [Xylanimonas protaetiae]
MKPRPRRSRGETAVLWGVSVLGVVVALVTVAWLAGMVWLLASWGLPA